MRKMILPLVNLILAITTVHVAGQDIATLKVEGRGVEGRPPYRGGGVVKFLDVSMGAQILHFQAEQEVPLPSPLQITYDVLEEAPVSLTSRLGTEHWQLYHFGAETMTPLYTDEEVDLSYAGRRHRRIGQPLPDGSFEHDHSVHLRTQHIHGKEPRDASRPAGRRRRAGTRSVT